MDMGCVAFQAYLAMALRDRPRWTTAELNETTVVFCDGEWARGATLHAEGSGRLDTKFDLNERTCNRLHADLVAWLAAPGYSVRPDVERWLSVRLGSAVALVT